MSRNFIVLDTEGVDTVKYGDGQPHPETGLFYDFGFIVANREGDILHEASFVNTDVFFQEGLMNSAYYANKLPQYREGLGTLWTPANTSTIWHTFKEVCGDYNVRDIWAYNVRYDMTICNATIREQSNGFVKYFAPYKSRYRDIWDYAGSTICNTQRYVEWCKANDFVSAKGNPSTSADTVGKYIYDDMDFVEQHTALSDCHVELDILLAAFRRHQKARHSKGQGWRDASAIAKGKGL